MPSTVCYVGGCTAPPDHTPCCSSHHRDLCHAHYRRTHFVEVCGCDRPGCYGKPPSRPPIAPPLADRARLGP